MKRDHKNWKTWSQIGLGDFSVMTSYAQRESNLDDNPSRPHYTEDETRLTLTHSLSQWPYLGYSLSYGTGSRKTTKQDGREASGPVDRIDASLTYSGNRWSSSLGTYRLDLTDTLAGGLDTRIDGYYLSASYYPTANFSLSPSVEISDEYYDSDGSNTARQSFSLSATRSFERRPFDITAYGQYYTDRNASWNLDTDGIYAETGVVWSLSQEQKSPSTLGLYLTYNAYTDHVFTDSSIEEAAAWLVFQFNRQNTLLSRAYRRP